MFQLSNPRLKNGVSTIDNTFTALENIVQTTYNDQRFRMFKYLNADQYIDPLVFSAITDAFSSAFVPHELVEDTGIIFTPGVILTRRRTFYSDTFFQFYGKIFNCDGLDYGQWLKLLGSFPFFFTVNLINCFRYFTITIRIS